MLRLVWLTLFVWLVGCAPATTYRRTALVPAPRGDTFTNRVRGVAELAGQAGYSIAPADRTGRVVGDPGLYVTTAQFGAHARFRLGRYFVVGAEGRFGHSELSEAMVGVPPLEGVTWGLGPTLSVHFPVSERVHLGIASAVWMQSVPWSTWELVEGGAPPGTQTFRDGDATYRISEATADVLPMFRLSFGVEADLNEWFSLFGAVSLQNALLNIGFDDEPRDGSTLSADHLGVVPNIGASFRHEALLVRVQYYVPVGFSGQQGGAIGPGGFEVTLAADLGERLPSTADRRAKDAYSGP